MSAVSVGSSSRRVLSESVSCVRCGGSLVVGSGTLCESCTHVVSVCVHDSGTDLMQLRFPARCRPASCCSSS